MLVYIYILLNIFISSSSLTSLSAAIFIIKYKSTSKIIYYFPDLQRTLNWNYNKYYKIYIKYKLNLLI